MEVFYKLSREKEPTAIALGYFDGIHIGHERVIMKATSYINRGLKPIILTFKESPRAAITGINERILTSEEQKIKIISHMGVQSLYILDFMEIKDMSSESFVDCILSDILNVKYAVCGFNYTFGAGGKSGSEDLRKLCSCRGINVDVIPSVKYKNEVVSSTRIRQAINNNNISDAMKMTRNI